MLVLSKINCKYKEHIIFEDATISIPKGKMTIISGESGCGKSTLLNMIGLISNNKDYKYQYDEHIINIEDEVEKALYRKSKIGYVFQDNNLHEYMSVEENLLLYAKINNISADTAMIDEILAKINLTVEKTKKVKYLSGGEKQRLAVGCALIKNSEIIIADEPTSSLDRANTNIIMNLFRTICDEGKTIVLVTHDESVIKFCDYSYRIRDRKIIQENTIEETNNNVTEIKRKNIGFDFLKWYTGFHFGRNKTETIIQFLIPAFIIASFVFFNEIQRSAKDIFINDLNQNIPNEVLVVNEIDGISDFAIEKYKELDYVSSVNIVKCVYQTDLIINDKKIDDCHYYVSEIYSEQIPFMNFVESSESGDVYVTYSLAAKLDVHAGDCLSINGQDYYIKAILSSDSSLMQSIGDDMIYLDDIDQEQSLIDKVLIELNDINGFTNINANIHTISPLASVYLSQETYVKKLSDIESTLQIFSSTNIYLIIFIIIGMGIYHTLLLYNMRYRIAVLKANGLSNKALNELFIFDCGEKLFYTFISSVIILVVYYIITAIFDFNIHFHFVTDMAILIGLLIIIYLLPIVYSIIYIVRNNPEKILRI